MFNVKSLGLRKIRFVMFAALLAIPLAAVAQVTTATIVGTVSDPSGAQVPSASVTARNIDTGLTRTTVTGSVNYYLDGGTNMTNLRNTGNVAPNPDAVQEFRIQTNSYNAEYGRFASGVVNVLTKSGTNKFHGSLYEFVRNDVFNANEWNSQLARPPYKRNQFGGTIGGPIRTDKTFFFFSYSGLRQITNQFLDGARVPTARERIGDFSQSGTPPKDPATGTTLANATNFSCNGVVGVICPNRIDPVAARIIRDNIPLSNITLNNGLPGWQGNVPLPFNTNEVLGKLDHQINDPHRLTFSYFTTAGSTTVFPGSGNLLWATQNFKWRNYQRRSNA